MADSIVEIDCRPGSTLLFLTAASADCTGAPEAGGYDLERVGTTWLHRATVPTALAGTKWYAEARPSAAGSNYGYGYLHNLTDTAQTFVAVGPEPPVIKAMLEAAHGTGSWEGGVGAAGGGPVPLTVTVETSGGDPLAGVNIYILDSNGDPTGAWLPTSAAGQCVFGLPPGDYQIAVASLAGYTTPAPIEKTLVADTAASETIVLASQATDPPGAAGLCTIDDYILDGSKAGVAGAIITATASADAVLVDPGVLTSVRARAVTDADGHFTLQLVRADAMSAGKDYTIEIKSQTKSIFRQITGPIPNATSATLNDIEAGA